MLRVYSVLYIEKLWNHNLSSDIVKQVPVKSTYGTEREVAQVSKPVEETNSKQVEHVILQEEDQSEEQEIAIEEIEIEAGTEAEVSKQEQVVVLPTVPIVLPEEEIIATVEEQVEASVSESQEPIVEEQKVTPVALAEEEALTEQMSAVEEVAIAEPIQETVQEAVVEKVIEETIVQEPQVMQVLDEELTIEIVQEAISEDVIQEIIPIREAKQVEQVEKVISNLAINTNRYSQISTILESPVEDIYSAGVADHSTSVSSTSSILSPLTPTSVSSGFHSPSQVLEDIEFEKKVQALPPPQPRKRTTSLFKRETDKINDKRKSLTKKLKRALTVKAENKRYSV